MSKENGGPAFPIHPDTLLLDTPSAFAGMTLRDYLAAKAMAGMLANPHAVNNPEVVAINAFAHADAMLAERAK